LMIVELWGVAPWEVEPEVLLGAPEPQAARSASSRGMPITRANIRDKGLCMIQLASFRILNIHIQITRRGVGS
jgi:hypothetical protein